MSEWRETTLGDVIELKRGYDLPQAQREKGIVPIVSSSGISDFHSKAMVKAPGVVTGRYGTIGQVYYISQDFWPLNTSLYVRDFKGNDPKFISYFLKSIDFNAYSDKGAVPGVNRNHLHMAQVKVPPLPIQRAIARVLGDLDDKIELNRQINQTLEQIAQTIFKSWFVDFEPVKAKIEAKAAGRDPERAAMCVISGLCPIGYKLEPELDQLPPEQRQQLAATAALFPDELEELELGLIPKGWEVKPLDQIANYLNGLALQKFPPESGTEWLPVIKISQLKKGDTDGADRASSKLNPEYVINDGDVLFSWSGSLEVDVWCGGPGALNQHLFKVASDDYPKWFYLLWTKHHLEHFKAIAAGKAVTIGHIQRKHLTEALCAAPLVSNVEQFGAFIAPLLEQKISNRKALRTLAALRDTLLPKLLSGELSVGECEQQVGACP